jgi:hypothetical protein
MAIASQRQETANRDKVAVATISYKVGGKGRARTIKVHNFLSNKPNASERRLARIASALGGKTAAYAVTWHASAPKASIDLRPDGEGVTAKMLKAEVLGS